MNTTVAIDAHSHYYQRLSWGAILAGLVIALIVHALLNFLSLAWGLASLNISQNGLRTPGFNAFFWLLFNNIVAMFAGGWVAGRLSAATKTTEVLLHGLLSWATTSLLSMLAVMLIAGTLLTGTVSLLGAGLGWIGENVTELVKDSGQPIVQTLVAKAPTALPDLRSAFDSVQQQADQALDLAEKNMNNSPAAKAQLHQQLSQLLMDFLHNSGDLAHRVTQQELNDFLVSHTELDQAQAEKMLDMWQTTYDDIQAKLQQQVEKAKQATSVAINQGANAMGMLALMSFLVLLTGAIAAGLGAVCGNVK